MALSDIPETPRTTPVEPETGHVELPVSATGIVRFEGTEEAITTMIELILQGHLAVIFEYRASLEQQGLHAEKQRREQNSRQQERLN